MSGAVIATTAINVSFDKEKNLEKILYYIDEAANEGANLVVFPEASLQGYLNDLFRVERSIYDYHHENAELIPGGNSVQTIIKKAIEKNIYVVWGMIERDPDQYYILYNTSVLVGPKGFIGTYRKIHQPGDEVHIFYSGRDWPVYETSIGKIGMMICYDKSFPESSRELALKGAEILVLPTAWPLRFNGGSYESDPHTMLYDVFDIARAVENQCFFISSNHVGVSGDHEFIGKSQIVAPDGSILSTVGFKEGICYAEADIRGEIIKSNRWDSFGWRKQRKPETYTFINI